MNAVSFLVSSDSPAVHRKFPLRLFILVASRSEHAAKRFRTHLVGARLCVLSGEDSTNWPRRRLADSTMVVRMQGSAPKEHSLSSP